MFDLNVYNLLIDNVELNRIEKKTISSWKTTSASLSY